MKNLQVARQDLLRIFQGGLERVNGRAVVSRYLQHSGMAGPCSLIAVGKAAQAMSLGAIDLLGDGLVDGLVISKPGHLDLPTLERHRLAGMEGGHPLPDERSLEAGRKLLDYLDSLPGGRSLLFLVSGGASSLVEVLREGVTLDDLRRVNRWLLSSGLSIHAMNRVRKALSVIKGGGLLRYLGTRPVSALLISDVVGDDPAVIGSGLLVEDAEGPGEMAEMILPGWLRKLLPPVQPLVSTGPTPDTHLVASLADARNAAADTARMLGYKARVSHAMIDAGAENAGHRLALELLDALPGVYIWGGEPTVRLPDDPGRGGRNQHLALAAARVIEGREDIWFLSAGTDGTDGPGSDAGALVDGGTLGRGRRAGLDAEQALLRADSGTFLAASGDLVQTGPTGTNVMDLIIGLKLGEGRPHG